jgi:putative ABC transport system substrate-binding protein
LYPQANVIALLVNPTSADITKTVSRDLRAAARNLGLQLHILNASTDGDFETVFTTLVQLRAGALMIAPDLFFITRNELLATLTIRHAVPAITQYREFATAGGLMSYGGSITDAARRVGAYTGRVLKGEKPADLPVQRSTKVELIINLVWGDFCQGVPQGSYPLSRRSVSLFDLAAVSSFSNRDAKGNHKVIGQS